MRRGKNFVIEITRPGYQSQSRIISRTHSVLGVLDIMGFFLYWPLLGLLSDGSWKYDTTDFYIKLEPEKSETVDYEPESQQL